jgi:pimeloyl-ACP methyl ester carboxylesterase
MVESPTPAPRQRRPWYHPLMLLQRLVIYIAVAYIVIGVFLAFKQTGMIYEGYTVPVALPEAIKQAKLAGLVPWENTAPGGTSPQGYVRPDFTASAPRGTVIFFHGNGESAWLWVGVVEPMMKRGFRVLLYEYPGYGGRPGVPSEKVIVPDVQALVGSLDAAGYGPIYLWGQSLGSGVAAAACADETLPIHGLTLVTPWDTLPNVGASYYPYFPVRLIMIDQYDSIANLQHFQHPICVIRGDKDDIIFPSLTLNLFAHLPDPKKMMVMRGAGHGDWAFESNLGWWDEALDFIAPKK